MKRLIAILLCVSLLLVPVAAHADGSGNIDNGGGGMGQGTNGNIWHGDDGVRVTVVRISDNKPVSRPIDLTNCSESNVTNSFVAKSKIHYRNGSQLQINQGKYKCTKPEKKIPKIISDSGNANISVIRKYFCSKWVVKKIATTIGTTYEKLTDGKYKLLLEPVAYFYFQGYKYAMTATEAAKYDEALSGGLRRKMVSLTHQQLPLSMFLERADLGYPAYKGSKTKAQSDTTIINELGLGIVKFSNDSSGDSGTDTATYRCDTDVVTSVVLSSDSDIYPDKPAKVTFRVLGRSYTLTDIVMPAGESQLVWVKWHTPKTPQKVNISVSSSKGNLSDDEVTANVVSLEEKTPPDPTATDRNDGFKTPDVPSTAQCLANSWSVWSAEWIPNWVWHEDWQWHEHKGWESGGEWEDDGEWVDEGEWEYTDNTYRASLSADMSLLPDDKVPTAKGKKMKSGYGVKINLTTNVKSSVKSWTTGAQTAITYFPEFEYKTYWRVLDRVTDGFSASFEFKTNKYSTYGRRVHFTPLWYPDGTYTAYTYLEDVWTPAGMLSANLTDYVTIKGNVYDDWHVGPQMVK